MNQKIIDFKSAQSNYLNRRLKYREWLNHLQEELQALYHLVEIFRLVFLLLLFKFLIYLCNVSMDLLKDKYQQIEKNKFSQIALILSFQSIHRTYFQMLKPLENLKKCWLIYLLAVQNCFIFIQTLSLKSMVNSSVDWNQLLPINMNTLYQIVCQQIPALLFHRTLLNIIRF